MYAGQARSKMSQSEAAEVLGILERTFRHYRDRFEADGAEGLYDRRLGRASARRDAQLQLGSADVAGARSDSAGAAARTGASARGARWPA